MGRLTEAFVELSTRDDKMRSGLAIAKGKLASWAASARSTLTIPVTIGGVILGAGVTKFLVDAAKAATDLGETVNKVRVTFGRSSEGIEREAARLSKEFGLVRNVSLEAYSNFGLIAQGAGFAEEASARLSGTLVKLAADAASFYNVPVEVALEKIRAGLVGQSQPLQAFGLNLQAAAVDLRALEMSGKASASQLTEYERTAARAAMITEGLSKASGDLERTSDSNANAMRRLNGRIEEFKTNIGEGLQDVMGDLLNSLETALVAMEDLFSPDRVKAFGDAVSSVVALTAKMGGELVDGKGLGMFETFGRNNLAAGLEGSALLFRGISMGLDNPASRRLWQLGQDQRDIVTGSITPTWDPTKAAGSGSDLEPPPPPVRDAFVPAWARDWDMFGPQPGPNPEEFGVTATAVGAAIAAAIGAVAERQGLIGEAERRMAELEAIANRPLAEMVGDQTSGYMKMQLDALNQDDPQREAVKELQEIKRLLGEINKKPDQTPAQELRAVLRGRS